MGKRVLIVTNSFWNIHNFRRELINDLCLSGADVGIVCPDAKKLENEFPGLAISYFSINNLGYDLKLFKHIGLFLYLIRVFVRFRPDAVFSFTIKPNLLCGLVSSFYRNNFFPVITGLGTSYTNKGDLSKPLKYLYKYSFKSANKVVFQNETDKSLFIDHNLVEAARTVLIHGSGINTARFQASKKQVSNTQFLFVGRLLKSKGVEEFYRAAEILNDRSIEFKVVGLYDASHPDTISEDLFKSMSSSKWLNFLGYHEDIRPFIENSTAVVLPTYREGLPKAILESLAMEKPVICSNVPGCKVFFDLNNREQKDKCLSEDLVTSEISKNNRSLISLSEKDANKGIGFQINVADPYDLADKLKEMSSLSDFELKKMGERGRELVLKYFDSTIINQQYLNLLYEKAEVF